MSLAEAAAEPLQQPRQAQTRHAQGFAAAKASAGGINAGTSSEGSCLAPYAARGRGGKLGGGGVRTCSCTSGGHRREEEERCAAAGAQLRGTGEAAASPGASPSSTANRTLARGAASWLSFRTRRFSASSWGPGQVTSATTPQAQ